MIRFLSVFVLVALGFMAPAHALFVSPDRLIIEDGQRSAEITISNRSDKPVVVRFDWERRAMNADGQLVLVEEGQTMLGYKPADPYIRFSPRQVVLQPRQHQKVRVLIRRTDDMTDGEYGSHFLIKEEPIKNALDSVAQTKSQNLSGKIELLVYRSMPVFLRQGSTTVDVKINDAYVYVKDGRPFLHLNLANNSTRSLYATPRLTCQQPDGTPYVADLNKVRLYTQWRSVSEDVPIAKKFTHDWSTCRSMSVELVDRRDFEYKAKPFAQSAVSMR